MSALRKDEPGAQFFEIPKAEIELGSLPPFEYEMLRAALRDAIGFYIVSAEAIRGTSNRELAERNRLLDRASEYRALQRRFLKNGRRGKSA